MQTARWRFQMVLHKMLLNLVKANTAGCERPILRKIKSFLISWGWTFSGETKKTKWMRKKERRRGEIKRKMRPELEQGKSYDSLSHGPNLITPSALFLPRSPIIRPWGPQMQRFSIIPSLTDSRTRTRRLLKMLTPPLLPMGPRYRLILLSTMTPPLLMGPRYQPILLSTMTLHPGDKVWMCIGMNMHILPIYSLNLILNPTIYNWYSKGQWWWLHQLIKQNWQWTHLTTGWR